MSKTLIAGCSYVHKLKFDPKVNRDRFDIWGSPGSGNQAIAARVAHQVTTNQYQKVLVLWSGVNRLDAPIGLNLHETFNYRYFDCVGPVAWYHSGGIGVSGQSSEAPKMIKQYFDTMYLGADQDYLSELTLQNILAVQSLLQVRNIDYQMSFIYDVSSKRVEQHENSHGYLTTDSKLYSCVDWTKFCSQAPWNWAVDRYCVEENEYYPTAEAFRQWFQEQMQVDLTR